MRWNHSSVMCIAFMAVLPGGLSGGCRPGSPSDELLMETAVTHPDVTARERAAYALCQRAADELARTRPDELATFLDTSLNVGRLRKLMERIDVPEVQAVAASGLAGVRDVDSLPKLIDLMESPSSLVRHRAFQAVSRIIGMTFQFDPSGPDEARAKLVAAYRAQYDLSLGSKAKDPTVARRLMGPEGLAVKPAEVNQP